MSDEDDANSVSLELVQSFGSVDFEELKVQPPTEGGGSPHSDYLFRLASTNSFQDALNGVGGQVIDMTEEDSLEQLPPLSTQNGVGQGNPTPTNLKRAWNDAADIVETKPHDVNMEENDNKTTLSMQAPRDHSAAIDTQERNHHRKRQEAGMPPLDAQQFHSTALDSSQSPLKGMLIQERDTSQEDDFEPSPVRDRKGRLIPQASFPLANETQTFLVDALDANSPAPQKLDRIDSHLKTASEPRPMRGGRVGTVVPTQHLYPHAGATWTPPLMVYPGHPPTMRPYTSILQPQYLHHDNHFFGQVNGPNRLNNRVAGTQQSGIEPASQYPHTGAWNPQPMIYAGHPLAGQPHPSMLPRQPQFLHGPPQYLYNNNQSFRQMHRPSQVDNPAAGAQKSVSKPASLQVGRPTTTSVADIFRNSNLHDTASRRSREVEETAATSSITCLKKNQVDDDQVNFRKQTGDPPLNSKATQRNMAFTATQSHCDSEASAAVPVPNPCPDLSPPQATRTPQEAQFLVRTSQTVLTQEDHGGEVSLRRSVNCAQSSDDVSELTYMSQTGVMDGGATVSDLDVDSGRVMTTKGQVTKSEMQKKRLEAKAAALYTESDYGHVVGWTFEFLRSVWSIDTKVKVEVAVSERVANQTIAFILEELHCSQPMEVQTPGAPGLIDDVIKDVVRSIINKISAAARETKPHDFCQRLYHDSVEYTKASRAASTRRAKWANTFAAFILASVAVAKVEKL